MKVVVAGHICLDIIPPFVRGAARLEPGRLLEVGAAQLSCGGGVANVGRALLKLGVDATLVGKVGGDALAEIIAAQLERFAAGSSQNLVRAADESTSYTVVLSPPGIDRIFLHHSGCNDTFELERVAAALDNDTDLLYFGYPPLMRRSYEDEGRALAAQFEAARARGITTLLDMAMPDPAGPSGRANWRAFLTHVLPHVDLFMPSLDEVSFMLAQDPPDPGDLSALRGLADALLGLGALMVGLKLGDHGLYFRSAGARQTGAGRALGADLSAWLGRELWAPVFTVSVAGTTGSGDATIAGFIRGLAAGQSPEGCLETANAVGAASVTALDALSGVPSYAELSATLLERGVRATHGVDTTHWVLGPHQTYRSREDTGG